MKNFKQLIVLRTKRLLKERNWTQFKLANEGGICYSTLSTVLKDKCPTMNSDTIIAIIPGFDMTVMEFFNCDLFLPENIGDN